MNERNDGVLQRRKLNDSAEAKITSAGPQPMKVQTQRPSRIELAARRVPRTADMLEALRQIDVAPTAQAQREILEWLSDVYERRQGGALIGLFGRCYLGRPYVDHAFSLTGEILHHYTATDAVPPALAGARPFAVSEAYAYVEVYADGQIVPVRTTGSPVL